MNRFRISVTTFFRVSVFCKGRYFSVNINHELAEIAQLGERQTEDLNVPGSIPGFGNIFIFFNLAYFFVQVFTTTCWSRD